jgi:hypothetical protein
MNDNMLEYRRVSVKSHTRKICSGEKGTERQYIYINNKIE